ncbi:MAG: DUF1302 family protein [Pseudomonas sp.]
MKKIKTPSPALPHFTLLGMLGVCAITGNAYGFQAYSSDDMSVHWDNTVQYNLGMRVKDADDRILNNPAFHESNKKFSDAGDIVTNRINVLSELDVIYKKDFGFRLSGSAWRDFAYDSDVEFDPAVMPAGSSYSGNKYDSYTDRYYRSGAQVLDAFLFAFRDNYSVRLGRLTQFWGNAVFFGAQGINYSQNAADNIKGSASPGTEAKELAIPRAQILYEAQLSDNLSIATQYFLEFQPNRNPEGGTYLGAAGFLWYGPDRMLGGLSRGSDYEPDEINNNFGVKLSWTPEWLQGTLGVYYRRLDEVQPWAPMAEYDSAGSMRSYHLAHADDVTLIGLSLDKQIGTLSTGFELSWRKDTALNSAMNTTGLGHEGARGDTLNVIANAISGLTPNRFYDTGTAVMELAYTRKLSVSDNKELYNGENDGGCPTGSKWDGCSTDDSLAVAASVTPQWLQVYPGLDLSMPLFVQYGVSGNAATLNGGVAQGAMVYTAGISALYRQTYKATLQYNGYDARAKTQNGIYTSGNGAFMWNDRDWISLTLSATF